MGRNATRKPLNTLGCRTTRRSHSRPLFLERLEDRVVLSSFSDAGNVLTANLAANKTVSINALASTETLTLAGDTWSGTNDTNVTGMGTATLTVTSAGEANLSLIQVTDSLGANANDAVAFEDSGTNTYANSIQIALTNAAAGPITFDGSTSFTGSSSLSAATSLNIVLDETYDTPTTVRTVSGAITLQANQQASPSRPSSGLYYLGISLSDNLSLPYNNTIVSTSGAVTLEGRGGGSYGFAYGVYLG